MAFLALAWVWGSAYAGRWRLTSRSSGPVSGGRPSAPAGTGRLAWFVRGHVASRFPIGPMMLGLLALAVAFHVYEALSEWTPSLFSFGVLVWSLTPYAAAVVIAAVTRRPLLGIVPVSLALLLDLYTLIVVRYVSHSSTAALAFLAVPLWNLVLVVPLGVAGAFLWLRFRHANSRAP